MLADKLARLALSPILITQALKVRKTAQMLPEAAGPRHGSLGADSDLRLRIIGDSSAAGVGAGTQDKALAGQLATALSQDFHVHWSLNAVTGATTRSTLARLADETPVTTDIVVTALGVNDITRLVSPRRWLALQTTLHDRLRQLYAPRRIFLCGLPPMHLFPLLPQPLRWTLGRQARAFDQLLSHYAAGHDDLAHVPFNLPLDPRLMAADGFHPSEALYQLWGTELAAMIRAEMAADDCLVTAF